MENAYCVYMHTLKLDGRKYIGITKNSPKRRWQNGRGYRHNAYFGSAIEKYGWAAFKHEILFENLSQEQAFNKEKALIKLFHTMEHDLGFNLTAGGDTNASREKYNIEKDTLYKLYIVQNKSMAQCALALKVPLTAIKSRLLKWNFRKTEAQVSAVLKSVKTEYVIDKDAFYELYIIQNKSAKECAKFFNCSREVISKRAYDWGFIKTKEQIGKVHSSIELFEKDLYYQYITLDKSLTQCAKYFNCCTSTIWKFIKKYNIKKI